MLRRIFGVFFLGWGTLVLVHGHSDPEVTTDYLTVSLGVVLLALGMFLLFSKLSKRPPLNPQRPELKKLPPTELARGESGSGCHGKKRSGFNIVRSGGHI